MLLTYESHAPWPLYATPLHGSIYAKLTATSSRGSYYSHSTSSHPKKTGPRLTRDTRRDILLLREFNDHENEAEYTYKRIVELLSKRHGRTVTQRAVQYTCNKHKATS